MAWVMLWERPTRRSPALGRLWLLILCRVSGIIVPGTASTVDYRTELSLPGDSMAPELASVYGVGAAFTCSPSGLVTLAASHPFSPIATSNSTVSSSPTLHLILCRLFRVMSVWGSKMSSPVSLRLMNPYPFLTLNHLPVPITLRFVSLPR